MYDRHKIPGCRVFLRSNREFPNREWPRNYLGIDRKKRPAKCLPFPVLKCPFARLFYLGYQKAISPIFAGIPSTNFTADLDNFQNQVSITMTIDKTM
jgi:hypothetical protein